jgi:hypothetical protein
VCACVLLFFLFLQYLTNVCGCLLCYLKLRMKVGSRILTLDKLTALTPSTDLLSIDSESSQVEFDVDLHSGAFTMQYFESDRSACSWREVVSVREMYIFFLTFQQNNSVSSSTFMLLKSIILDFSFRMGQIVE